MKIIFRNLASLDYLLKAILLAALILVPVYGISCQQAAPSGQDESTPLAPSPASVTTDLQEVMVVINGFAFKPPILNIKQGTTVTWRNEDSVGHNVTTDDNSFKSETLSRDQTFTYTFEKSGTFSYTCTIHPRMTGKIIVE
ncbi:MAG: cupredoxin family copper-binding protein [Dehalococcoidia bacterium]|nr:cupredoxin family copper-binding protein [Dehalococcoidia bacterium]